MDTLQVEDNNNFVYNAIRRLSNISVLSFFSADGGSDDGSPAEDIPDLKNSLKDMVIASDLFFGNKYAEALAYCQKWAKHSVFHAMGMTYMRATLAYLTFEPTEIELAKEEARNTLKLCNKKRKKVSMYKTLSSFFVTPDYNSYTDEEAHVELFICHANIALTLISFVGDQSFVSLLKGALRMRAANIGYKFLNEMIKHRNQWTSEQSRRDFKGGVYMGLGQMSLVLSHLPAKVLKLLSFAGFSGDRKEADRMLHFVTSELKDTYSFKLVEFATVFYNLYLEQMFGLGASDLVWVKNLLDESMAKNPDEAFNLFFYGRLHQLSGKPDQAIECFNKSINAQDKWKQIHNVCYWDLVWCYAVQCDWKNAIKYARKLKEESKWSPATNMYQVACFLHMMMEETGNTDLKPEILKAMQEVPELKVRFGGKTMPPEKFAITKALKYVDGEDVTLPALELFYIWNIFGSCSPDHLKRFSDIIDKKTLECKKNIDDQADGYYLCLLLKGVCLRLSGRRQEAIDNFKEIIEYQTLIQKDTYIPPQAALELGLTHLEVKNYSEAKEWLEKARDKYTGFVAETLVHLRVHGALTKMKRIESEN